MRSDDYWAKEPEQRWSNALAFALEALKDDDAPEVVLAPLRVAHYVARGLLRRRRELEDAKKLLRLIRDAPTR